MEGVLLPAKLRRPAAFLGIWLGLGVLAGSVAGCSDSSGPQPLTVAATGTTSASTTTTLRVVSKTITTRPSSKVLRWGEKAEIRDVYARVSRPVEESALTAPAHEGMKFVSAMLWLSAEPEGEFVAYDQEARPYRSQVTPWPRTSSSDGEAVGPFTGSLVYEVPEEATITRIVWTWDSFEWINQLIWEDKVSE